MHFEIYDKRGKCDLHYLTKYYYYCYYYYYSNNLPEEINTRALN